MIATTGEENVGTPTTEYENNALAGCGGYYFVGGRYAMKSF